MAKRSRPIGEANLTRWRQLDATHVLAAVADYAKKDPTFVPVKDASSSRWHANVSGVDFELLLTGPRFWDCRAHVGGGGAIDLVMHLTGMEFRAAATRLKSAGL